MPSNSPRSSHIPWHCGHQSIRIEELPKITETMFTVLHFTQGRFVATMLVFSMFSISSFIQRREPSSSLFFSFRNSSFTSQRPLHLEQPSNCILKIEYSFRVFPQAGQISEVALPISAP